MKRRNFTKITAFGSLIGLAPTEIFSKSINSKKDIKISLAQWSLNNAIKSGKLSPLDFAKKAKSFGIDAIEYVSGLYTNHTDTLEKMSMNKLGKELLKTESDFTEFSVHFSRLSSPLKFTLIVSHPSLYEKSIHLL